MGGKQSSTSRTTSTRSCVLSLNNDGVIHDLHDAETWDREFSMTVRVNACDILGKGFDEVFGEENDAAIKNLCRVLGHESFSLRLDILGVSLVGIVSHADAQSGCCGLPTLEVEIINGLHALSEKTLARQRAVPTQYLCSSCKRWNADGIEYSTRLEMLEALAKRGFVALHHTASSSCYKCNIHCNSNTAAKPRKEATSMPARELKSYNVLVAIADDVGCKGFSRAAEQVGMSVTTCAHSSIALQHLKQRKFDFVVCDMVLPPGGASSLINVIRQTYGIPVLATGGNCMFSELALHAGATVFIPRYSPTADIKKAFYSMMNL